MKTTSTQTETLTLKDRMKGYRPKFRKGGGYIPQTKTKTNNVGAPDGNSIKKKAGKTNNVGAPDGNSSKKKAGKTNNVGAPDGNSSKKKAGCLPKRFSCGTKQQLQQQQQQIGGGIKIYSPTVTPAAPKDEMRQDPDVIEMDDVQANKVEDELLNETRIPAEEAEPEKVVQEDLKEEGELSTVEIIDTTTNSNASIANNIDDKAKDAVKEHAESMDDKPQPEHQQEAVDEVSKVPSKEHAEDSRETICPTANTNIMGNAMDAMETAMCTFTNALETAMSSLSSHKGGAVDDQQDKKALDSPQESQKEGADEQHDNHLSAPLEKQTSIKSKTNYPEESTGSSNNMRPPLMPPQLQKIITKDENTRSASKGNALKNLKASLTRSKKEEQSEGCTSPQSTKGGSDSVKSWPMRRKKKSVIRFRKIKKGRTPLPSEAAAATAATTPDVNEGAENNKKEDDDKEEERSTKGESSTLATPTTMKQREPKTTDGKEDAKDDVPTDVDIMLSSRDEIEATINMWSDDDVFNRTHSLSSRCSQKEEKEETSPKNDVNNLVVVNRAHSYSSRGSQKSHSSRGGSQKEEKDKVSRKNEVKAAGMGSIGSVVSLFMRSLANPQKDNNFDSLKMNKEADVEAPALPESKTPEEEKGEQPPYQEQGNSDVVAAASSSAKEKLRGSQTPSPTLPKSDSQMGKDNTTDDPTRDSNENEIPTPAVTDQPATSELDQEEDPVPEEAQGEETTENEFFANENQVHANEITMIDTQKMDDGRSSPNDDDTPESDVTNRSSPHLLEQQQADAALENVNVNDKESKNSNGSMAEAVASTIRKISSCSTVQPIEAKNSNGSMAEAVASMIRKISSCSTVQPIEAEKLKGDEDAIPLQPLRIFPSSSSGDNREQRQEVDEVNAGDDSHSDGNPEGKSSRSKEGEEDVESNSSNIDNAPVMRSELLEGKVNFGRSDSNISSISVDKNAKVAPTTVQKTQKEEEEEEEDEDHREGPVSDGNSMDEVIIDATREFTDTYTMVNWERKKQALSELRRSTYLDSLATSHAIVMAELLTLGHSVDSLSALQDQLHSDDVGENIQRGKDERDMHKLAMEAGTSSRYNILRPTYKQYGMGTAVGEDGMVYMVQLFRGPVKEAFHQVERMEPSSVWCSSLWC